MMIKAIRKNAIAFVIILVSLVIGLFYMRSIGPNPFGDWKEYVLQTIAFKNHFSFGVTEEDLSEAMIELPEYADEMSAQYHTYANPWHPYGDAQYSNHNGSYSALVAPVQSFLKVLGVGLFWSYPITNFILYFAAVLVAFFCLKTDKKKKLLITLLTIINPALFYLNWIHSEVYLYAFMVMGLVFYYNKQYARSIFFLCVASMQNLAILPFAMMVGIELIIGKVNEYRSNHGKFHLPGFLKAYALKILPYGLCYIPGILPPVMTFVRFNTFNLVAGVAMERQYILHKSLGYLFDLNLGIFPFAPIILLLFIVMVLIGLKRIPIASITHLLGVGGMLFVIGCQRQINCGMQYIMRYNVWILPAMIFFVILQWDSIWRHCRGLLTVGLLEAVYTTVIIVYILSGYGDYAYVQFSPLAKAAMNSFPGLYNPTHGIFYSRATGMESYYSDEPVAYNGDDGYVRKILLSREAEEKLYSPAYVFCKGDGARIDPEFLKSDLASERKIDEGDYKYLNIPSNVYYLGNCEDTGYALGSVIHFTSEGYNADRYAVRGLSVAEEWGSWTDGHELFMTMLADGDASEIHAHLDVAGTYNRPQRAKVYVNGELVCETTLEDEQDVDFSFKMPESRRILIRICLPDAISPAIVDSSSSDTRKLGLGLRSLTLTDSEATADALPAKPEAASRPVEANTIRFDRAHSNAQDYIVSGFSSAEEAATWTDGNAAILRFSVANAPAGQPIHVQINLCAVFNGAQRAVIDVNGQDVFDGSVTPDAKTISFDAPPSEDQAYTMTIQFPDAVSPKSLGMSDDGRLLALMIESIQIQ